MYSWRSVLDHHTEGNDLFIYFTFLCSGRRNVVLSSATQHGMSAKFGVFLHTRFPSTNRDCGKKYEALIIRRSASLEYTT